MSALSWRLPESLAKRVRKVAEREAISINPFMVTAVAKKLAGLMTEEDLQERAKRGSRAKYEAALAQVPDVEPEPYDRVEDKRAKEAFTTCSSGSSSSSAASAAEGEKGSALEALCALRSSLTG